jgi:hypothetical protein
MDHHHQQQQLGEGAWEELLQWQEQKIALCPQWGAHGYRRRSQSSSMTAGLKDVPFRRLCPLLLLLLLLLLLGLRKG